MRCWMQCSTSIQYVLCCATWLEYGTAQKVWAIVDQRCSIVCKSRRASARAAIGRLGKLRSVSCQTYRQQFWWSASRNRSQECEFLLVLSKISFTNYSYVEGWENITRSSAVCAVETPSFFREGKRNIEFLWLSERHTPRSTPIEKPLLNQDPYHTYSSESFGNSAQKPRKCHGGQTSSDLRNTS